jgi:hypothetical protein
VHADGVSTDGERREIAGVLAAYGPPLSHFAELVAGADLDDVHVGSISGPVPARSWSSTRRAPSPWAATAMARLRWWGSTD